MDTLNRLCTHPDHPGVVLRPVMIARDGLALCNVYDSSTGAPSPLRRFATTRLLVALAPDGAGRLPSGEPGEAEPP